MSAEQVRGRAHRTCAKANEGGLECTSQKHPCFCDFDSLRSKLSPSRNRMGRHPCLIISATHRTSKHGSQAQPGELRSANIHVCTTLIVFYENYHLPKNEWGAVLGSSFKLLLSFLQTKKEISSRNRISTVHGLSFKTKRACRF